MALVDLTPIIHAICLMSNCYACFIVAQESLLGVAPIRPDSWLPVDGSCG